MTKGLKEGEPNGRDVYPDIIDHPHWKSPTRPHMSLYDRAAQFSAFDALAGYIGKYIFHMNYIGWPLRILTNKWVFSVLGAITLILLAIVFIDRIRTHSE